MQNLHSDIALLACMKSSKMSPEIMNLKSIVKTVFIVKHATLKSPVKYNPGHTPEGVEAQIIPTCKNY